MSFLWKVWISRQKYYFSESQLGNSGIISINQSYTGPCYFDADFGKIFDEQIFKMETMLDSSSRKYRPLLKNISLEGLGNKNTYTN